MLGHQKKATGVIDQFIMINAFKEGRDDDREASNLNRLFPELVSFHGAKAQAHQNLASLIKGDVAGSYVPMVHGAILAILIILFVFIVPMSFMPGGFQTFTTWVRLIFWVSLWPPFFAVFEALAATSLVGATQSFAASGHSIVTHTALTDIAFDAYAYFKSSLLLVPVISWFIVSGSSYAVTQFANGVMGSAGEDAQRGASDVVEGNVSFDNQNYGNRTVGSVSLGQQTLGPSLSYGSHRDTGGMSLTFDPTTGHVHGDHRVSQMQSNITSTDSFSAALNKEMSEAHSATQEARMSYESASQDHATKTMAMVESFATGDISIKGFTKQENLDGTRLLEQARNTSLSGGMETTHQKSDANDTSFKAHAGISTGGALAKAIGIDAGFSADTSFSQHESKAAINKIATENNWSENDRNTLTRILQSIKSGNFEAKTEHGRTLSKDYQESFEKTNRLAQDVSASESYMRNLTTAQQLQDRGEITVARNLNDEVVSFIAKERFGGDTAAAHQWASQHDDEFVRIGTDYAQHRSETLFSRLKTGQNMSEDQIKGFWQEGASHVQESARTQGGHQDASMETLGDRLQKNSSNANDRINEEQIVDSLAKARQNLDSNHHIAKARNDRADELAKADLDASAKKVKEETGKEIKGRNLEHYIPKVDGAHDF